MHGSSSSAGVQGAADLVEKEARRLEVLRRRQEKEIAQLVAYEKARKEIKDKAEAKASGGGSGLGAWRHHIVDRGRVCG